VKDHVNHKVELSGSIIDGGKFDLADFKRVSPNFDDVLTCDERLAAG
jgi:hypothetical protein